MNEVFGPAYAAVYDTVYADKDYAFECDLIESLVRDKSRDPVALDILDLGCGSGGHAVVLAQRGHRVVGVDRSADMIAAARRKTVSLNDARLVEYHVADIRDLRLASTFDAVIMMFAVLGYQIENQDVLATLRTARAHLRAGGRLLFDGWYGPAVLHQRPSTRTRTIDTPEGRMTRTASAALDVDRQICTIDIAWRRAGESASRRERHLMRFFFPRELELLLTAAGFERLRLGAWPEVNLPASETTWNMFALAAAV